MPRPSFDDTKFRLALRTWFRKQARDLPWRKNRDPYAILISEFMLQQTQVVTVLPYYKRWLERFPTIQALAQADEQEVLGYWQGLGYYARARNLHRAARELVVLHGGIFPTTLSEMKALPGLGDYTAGAVLTFAFDAQVPIVDANIARVLARLFDVQIPIDSSVGKQRIWEIAANLVPLKKPGEHNAALMELGALVCLPKPRCPDCPVRSFCQATNPAALPLKRPRAAITRKVERALFIEKGERVLLQQRTVNPWKGMWVLPEMDHSPEPREQPLLSHRYGITRYQVLLEIFPPAHTDPARIPGKWVDADTLTTLPIPSPHRRVLEALLGDDFSGFATPTKRLQ